MGAFSHITFLAEHRQRRLDLGTRPNRHHRFAEAGHPPRPLPPAALCGALQPPRIDRCASAARHSIRYLLIQPLQRCFSGRRRRFNTRCHARAARVASRGGICRLKNWERSPKLSENCVIFATYKSSRRYQVGILCGAGHAQPALARAARVLKQPRLPLEIAVSKNGRR